MVDVGPLPGATERTKHYWRDHRFRVFVVGADGSDLRRISGDTGTISVPLPSWSSDGSMLAYVEQGWIYLADGEGRNPSALAPGNLAHWMPDGGRIWYHSGESHAWESIVIDGSDRRKLFGDLQLMQPAVSPDGSLFAASVADEEKGFALATATGEIVQRLAETYFYIAGPAWSPDGSRVAFAAVEDEDGTTMNLYAVAVADGSVRKVCGDVVSEDDALFSWSPDGERLAAVRYADGGEALYVIQSDGSDERRLLNLNVADGSGEIRPTNPAWSPDGRYLAASTMTSQTFEIDLFSPDGRLERRLAWDSPVLARIDDLAWRPTTSRVGS